MPGEPTIEALQRDLAAALSDRSQLAADVARLDAELHRARSERDEARAEVVTLRSELALANRALIVGEFGDALNRADAAESALAAERAGREAILDLLRRVRPVFAVNGEVSLDEGIGLDHVPLLAEIDAVLAQRAEGDGLTL